MLYFKDLNFIIEENPSEVTLIDIYTYLRTSVEYESTKEFNDLIDRIDVSYNLKKYFICILKAFIEALDRFSVFLEQYDKLEEKYNKYKKKTNNSVEKELTKAKEIYKKFIVNLTKEIKYFSLNFENINGDFFSIIFQIHSNHIKNVNFYLN